ncbi:hypothetical protein ACFORG_20625 [Lutimaribacter marinistellae]|uniref:Uncharacterized protein n=1 Tax=Lutimaribacter marinistellae TaxID=1820329 RepID=A0ABV7TKT5_9RHOB
MHGETRALSCLKWLWSITANGFDLSDRAGWVIENANALSCKKVDRPQQFSGSRVGSLTGAANETSLTVCYVARNPPVNLCSLKHVAFSSMFALSFTLCAQAFADDVEMIAGGLGVVLVAGTVCSSIRWTRRSA